ncbi:hypothetical protein HDU79_003105 [Rhizoclosmatium sp. JEL0117]|nr:hypothetical protein HDU79_003105 [Rhizoclosmatium sp. JEL0117]
MLAGVHFSKAIATLFACRLNYDPDFVVPTATDTEKENRRHLFWIMYFLAKNVEIAVAKYPFRPIDCSQVKFAKKPNSTKPLWESPSNEIATVCYISGILDLIREATQLWHKVPSNILEITNSPILSTLRTRLQILQTQIPGHLIVSADKYLEFTTIFLGREIVSDALITTIYYYSAVSVMNRPILYLTKYLPSNSPYLVPLGPIIMSTLLESLLAAETVVGLVSWLLHQCRLGLDGEGGTFRESLWRDMTLSSLNMFEAVISLWFALTQTQSFWWNLVSTTASGPNNPNIVQVMDLNRRIRLRTQVLDVLQTLKDLETSLACAVSDRIYYANFQSTNFITPMVSCIVKMVEQMEDVEKLVGGIPTPQETEVESVAIEISVFSLTEADPEIPAPVTLEPWVLLGLLGVNVKGLTWNAWYEEEWRQFWLQVARGEK